MSTPKGLALERVRQREVLYERLIRVETALCGLQNAAVLEVTNCVRWDRVQDLVRECATVRARLIDANQKDMNLLVDDLEDE